MSTEQTRKLTKKAAEKSEETIDEISLDVVYSKASEEVKPVKQKRIISLEPYFNPDDKFMGYERYGYSGFPGGAETVNLSYVDVGLNKHRYLTGLDTKARRIQMIDDLDEKQAAINEIEKTLTWLEERGYDRQLLDPMNDHFWGKKVYTFENNKRRDLNFNDPEDVILYWNILGGGFDSIALSLKDAKKSNYLKKWYLAEIHAEAKTRIELKRAKATAISLLNEAFDTRPRKLFLIAKNILSPDNYFRNNTPHELIYDKLYDFIEGTSVESGKKETPGVFIKAAEKDNEDLLITALVRDAIFFRIVKKRSDGLFVNLETGSTLGKNENEMFEHLKNPLYTSDYDTIEAEVTKKWSK